MTIRLLQSRYVAYNRSDKPQGVENYELPYLTSDVVAVMDDLGEQSGTLVGHDWGGIIAWVLRRGLSTENRESSDL